MLKRSTDIKFDPPETESGYFMTAAISPGARDMIPERYFRPNVNYEDDKDTIVK